MFGFLQVKGCTEQVFFHAKALRGGPEGAWVPGRGERVVFEVSVLP